MVEHYSDGDLVNENSPFEKQPAGPNSLFIWGPNLPLAFMSGKLEDIGQVFRAPLNVKTSTPAIYKDRKLEIQ